MIIKAGALFICFFHYMPVGAATELLPTPEQRIEVYRRIRAMVKETGAVSTDYESPETADTLCVRTTPYAEDWKPALSGLWKTIKSCVSQLSEAQYSLNRLEKNLL